MTAERRERLIPLALLALAALGWWWSAVTADDMAGMEGSMDGGMGLSAGSSMSLAAFVVAWVAMMAAMMFPAVSPVVRLYARAAARGTVAPLPVFVAGYLFVWSAIGLPAYAAFDALEEPLADGDTWVARLAGAALLAAALYQFTPLKRACLRHCRSPLSFFMRQRGLNRPLVALRAGLGHGLFCLGCCWAFMVVLVAVGAMELAWMAALAVLILVEKVSPMGEQLSRVASTAFVALGGLLIARPSLMSDLT